MRLIFFKSKTINKKTRINEDITSSSVRLIGDDGEQFGVVSIEDALSTARAKELDLVEVSPGASPPVCKIMDFGKYIYTQKKIETKHKKSQKKTVVKGVRLTFKIGDHDLNVRINQAKKFLESGNVVKVTMLFRGREIVYKDLGKEKFIKFQEALKDLSNIDSPPTLQGNTLQMMLTPIK